MRDMLGLAEGSGREEAGEEAPETLLRRREQELEPEQREDSSEKLLLSLPSCSRMGKDAPGLGQ